MSIVEWFILKFNKASQGWVPSICRKWVFYLLLFLPSPTAAFWLVPSPCCSCSQHPELHKQEPQQTLRPPHAWSLAVLSDRRNVSFPRETGSQLRRVKMTLLHQQPSTDQATATQACSWSTTTWELKHLLRSWPWFPCLIWQAATG